jgi:hypothetical protein
MGVGYFGKGVKNWVDGMDVCVRIMGELVPGWLGMFGVVHLVIKDRVA